jgi:hypothetical protein
MTGLAAGGLARGPAARSITGLAADSFMHTNAYILPHEKTFRKRLTLQKILSYYKNKLIKKPL